MAVFPRSQLPGRGSELDRRTGLKDGAVNKAENSCLKSSYPTLRPSQTLCPQLFHPPARTRQRDKRGSPRMASLLLTAQDSDSSSMQPSLCVCFSQSTEVLSIRLGPLLPGVFYHEGVCTLSVPHRTKHVAYLRA